ncbi:iron-containing alcohol dehydrogenase [Luedemannella flava]|uniref:Iron-containing alcohol dehydrogenase n=1 Tax=Luedemannella flava TaxID=349316 RepID=A0ABN2LBI1_9ACTN
MESGASFEFATAARLIVGAGRAAELPPIVAGIGSRAIVYTGAHPARHEHLLAGLGVPYSVFAVGGEPTLDDARAAVRAAGEQGADVVVAVGGGSVIDLAKAAAMIVANGGDPLDYLELIGHGRGITRPSVPLVAVPTTAGTGAEVTANAVLSSPEHRIKASLRSPLMIPRVALVDPLLTLGCPPSVTASSGLDALTQCLEPFVSVRANPLTDALAREGLRRAATGLRRAYADGTDVDARGDMSLCSVLGGMALANAKLGAVHGFAGVIGATVDIPHGMACAALLAPVVAANTRALRARQPDSPALARYEEAARILTGRPDASVTDGVGWLRETQTMLGVGGLGAYGLRPEHADDIVAKAAKASSMQGNPIVLEPDELHAALDAAM